MHLMQVNENTGEANLKSQNNDDLLPRKKGSQVL